VAIGQRSLADMVIKMDTNFWQGKRVFLTGHTGFKGSWLSLWLQLLGAELIGFALDAPTTPNLFETASVADGMISLQGDIRDFETVSHAMSTYKPEIVIHMAAQSLVRQSYAQPVDTYATNVMGTVHLLEAIRHTPSVSSVVIVTSDKCYENQEWLWGYRENEPMGGHDPYSNSKGCAELVTDAYQRSFFATEQYANHQVAIATGRAGNVIGGGDWAADRLVPDILKAIQQRQPVVIRNPLATRPWQHVLEPLKGYLMLAEKLYMTGVQYNGGWNFGPPHEAIKSVSWVVEQLLAISECDIAWQQDTGSQPHEAHALYLDSTKAYLNLNWQPTLDLMTTLNWIVEWDDVYTNHQNIKDITITQIERYMMLDRKAISS